jgi:hypothetical protein
VASAGWVSAAAARHVVVSAGAAVSNEALRLVGCKGLRWQYLAAARQADVVQLLFAAKVVASSACSSSSSGCTARMAAGMPLQCVFSWVTAALSSTCVCMCLDAEAIEGC